MDIQTTIIGRLTKDVDLEFTPNGNPVGHFNLAVRRSLPNKNGVRESDFPYFEIWKNVAISFAEQTKKGVRVAVQAVYRTESYQKNGKQHYRNYWLVQSFEPLEKLSNDPTSSAQHQESNNYQKPFNREERSGIIPGMNEYGGNTHNGY